MWDEMTTNVLQSGTKWGTFLVRSRSGVAGLLPLRHLGSTRPPSRFAIRHAPWPSHGTFEHTLDAKNRLTVPSKFRAALAGRVFLVKGDGPLHLACIRRQTYTAMTQRSARRA